MDILLQHALFAKSRSYLNGILLQAKPYLVLNLLCEATRTAFGNVIQIDNILSEYESAVRTDDPEEAFNPA